MKNIAFGFVFVSGLIVACGTAPTEVSQSSDALKVVRRTGVKPNGDSVDETFYMSDDEFQAMVAAKTEYQHAHTSDGIGSIGQAYISSDAGCAGTDVWIYLTNGSMLCEFGVGSGDLNFARASITQYWPGSQPGRFIDTNQALKCNRTAGEYSVNGPLTTADSDVAAAWYTQQGPRVCPYVSANNGSPVGVNGTGFTPNTTAVVTIKNNNGTTVQTQSVAVGSDGKFQYGFGNLGCSGITYPWSVSATDQTDLPPNTGHFSASNTFYNGCKQ